MRALVKCMNEYLFNCHMLLLQLLSIVTHFAAIHKWNLCRVEVLFYSGAPATYVHTIFYSLLEDCFWTCLFACVGTGGYLSDTEVEEYTEKLDTKEWRLY